MKNFSYYKYIYRSYDNEILDKISLIDDRNKKLKEFEDSNNYRLTKYSRNNKVQSVYYFAKNEDIKTSITRVRQLFRNNTELKNNYEKLLLGYIDAIYDVNRNYLSNKISVNYILKLHRELFSKTNSKYAGVFKKDQNYVYGNRSDGTKYIRFIPVAPEYVEDCLNRICNCFNEVVAEERLLYLIIVSVFLLDFICIYPFNRGNRDIKVLLFETLMLKFGYNVFKYVSIEKIIVNNFNRYYTDLTKSANDWESGTNDSMVFVNMMLDFIIEAYDEFENNVKTVSSKKLNVGEIIELEISKMPCDFTKKQLLEKCPFISETSAERVLKKLLDENKIEKHGEKRGTYYIMK